MESIYYKFYKGNSHEFNELHERRISFESTVHLGLTIKPMNQPNIYELYYIPTNDLIKKVTDIYKMATRLNMKLENLPLVAKEQFILERMVEEQYYTNEIEGVKSTKAEIAKSVQNIKDETKKKSVFIVWLPLITGL